MAVTIHTPTQLGRALQAQRKALDLTQKQAADLVGLLSKTVSRLERNPSTATIESLFKLLSALRLELVVQPKNHQATGRDW